MLSIVARPWLQVDIVQNVFVVLLVVYLPQDINVAAITLSVLHLASATGTAALFRVVLVAAMPDQSCLYFLSQQFLAVC